MSRIQDEICEFWCVLNVFSGWFCYFETNFSLVISDWAYVDKSVGDLKWEERKSVEHCFILILTFHEAIAESQCIPNSASFMFRNISALILSESN